MPEYLSPGVYMEEFEIGARPIRKFQPAPPGFWEKLNGAQQPLA